MTYFPPDPPASVRWRFVNEAGETVEPSHRRPIAPQPKDAKSLSPAEYAAAKKRLLAEAAASLVPPLAADGADARQMTYAEYRLARAKLAGF